jgi:phospholipase A-2-activating protein
LSQLTSTPPKAPSISLTAAHIETVIQILDRWPSSQCFPGIIDN